MFIFPKKLNVKYTRISNISEESLALYSRVINPLVLKFFSSGAEEVGMRSVYLDSLQRAGNLLRAGAKGGPGSPHRHACPPPNQQAYSFEDSGFCA